MKTIAKFNIFLRCETKLRALNWVWYITWKLTKKKQKYFHLKMMMKWQWDSFVLFIRIDAGEKNCLTLQRIVEKKRKMMSASNHKRKHHDFKNLSI